MNKKIIIVILVIVLIVVLAIIFLLTNINRSTQIGNLAINNEASLPSENNQVKNPVNSPPLSNEQKEELILKGTLINFVRNFVERYGSYSSDGNFINLLELKDQMSDAFWRQTQNYINQRTGIKTPEFYGVTTKVLNITEEMLSETIARYSILTQKQETVGRAPQVSYPRAEVKIIKEHNEWRIDSLKWF